MNEIQNSLIAAMQLFADKSAQMSNATITIKAEITEIVNPATGIYKVKYLDNNLTVYTNSNLQYSVGDLVYILIPDGDFSKDKMIIGNAAVGSSSETVGDTLGYYEISDNLLEAQDNFSLNYELCSYKPETKTAVANFIRPLLKEYFTQSRELCFSFKIQTRFPREQTQADVKGSYGMSLIIPMEISIPGYSETQNTEFVWTLDTSNLLGNVYKFEIPTLQTIRSTIGEEYEISYDADRDIRIVYFCKGFPKTESGKPNDIFFTDVKVAVVKSFTQEQMQGLSLQLKANKGTVFRLNAPDMEKTITPIVRNNGKEIDLRFLESVFWFIEDTSINIGSEHYNQSAGAGWRMLNQTSVSGDPISQTTYPAKRDDDVKYTKYKCVVLYDKSILSETIEIINLFSDRDLKLESVSGQTTLVKDNSYFDLKASVKELNTENVNDFSFDWVQTTLPGDIIPNADLVERINTQKENGYIAQTVRIRKSVLTGKDVFKCTIKKGNK